jgi:hypothetical protein
MCRLEGSSHLQKCEGWNAPPAQFNTVYSQEDLGSWVEYTIPTMQCISMGKAQWYYHQCNNMCLSSKSHNYSYQKSYKLPKPVAMGQETLRAVHALEGSICLTTKEFMECSLPHTPTLK